MGAVMNCDKQTGESTKIEKLMHDQQAAEIDKHPKN